MIEMVIQAGFGNQLFQYAFGYALAKATGRNLNLNVCFFNYVKNDKHMTKRFNNLDKLKIDYPNFIKKEDNFKRFMIGYKLSKIPIVNHLPFVKSIVWEDIPNCRRYQSSKMDKVMSQKKSTIYGFWQNTKYFERYRLDIKRQFVPNYQLAEEVEQIKKQISETPNSVGVHIRRGDFINLGWAEGATFYQKAMKRMTDELTDCHFFIVSDDKKWVAENFGNLSNATLIDIKTETCDIDEFFLLSLCANQIISESTFGWWAAFLNLNSDRKIIIPKTAQGDMFPESWIRI